MTTTQLSDKGRNGQTAPRIPDDPFATIPNAYGDDWDVPAAPVTTKPAVQTPPPAAAVPVVTRIKVVDCPSYAWDNSDQAARDELGSAFYGEFSVLLDEAAYEAIRAHLIAGWRRAGRLCRLVDGGEFTRVTDTPDEWVPDEQRWAVWQAAADQISGAELVFAAGLTDEYRDDSDRDY
jgi:hypothetical protein